MSEHDHQQVEHLDEPSGVIERNPVLTVAAVVAVASALLAAPELVGMPDWLRVVLVVVVIVGGAVAARSQVSPA